MVLCHCCHSAVDGFILRVLFNSKNSCFNFHDEDLQCGSRGCFLQIKSGPCFNDFPWITQKYQKNLERKQRKSGLSCLRRACLKMIRIIWKLEKIIQIIFKIAAPLPQAAWIWCAWDWQLVTSTMQASLLWLHWGYFKTPCEKDLLNCPPLLTYFGTNLLISTYLWIFVSVLNYYGSNNWQKMEVLFAWYLDPNSCLILFVI